MSKKKAVIQILEEEQIDCFEHVYSIEKQNNKF